MLSHSKSWGPGLEGAALLYPNIPLQNQPMGEKENSSEREGKKRSNSQPRSKRGLETLQALINPPSSSAAALACRYLGVSGGLCRGGAMPCPAAWSSSSRAEPSGPRGAGSLPQPERCGAGSGCFLANFTGAREANPSQEPAPPGSVSGDIMGLPCNPSRRAAGRAEMGGDRGRGAVKELGQERGCFLQDRPWELRPCRVQSQRAQVLSTPVQLRASQGLSTLQRQRSAGS